MGLSVCASALAPAQRGCSYRGSCCILKALYLGTAALLQPVMLVTRMYISPPGERADSSHQECGSLYWWCWADGASWMCVGYGRASRKRPPAMAVWVICHLPTPCACCSFSIPYSSPPSHLPCICQVGAVFAPTSGLCEWCWVHLRKLKYGKYSWLRRFLM